MKHDNGNRLGIGLLERLFQQPRSNPWMIAMDLVEKFYFLGAQSRGTSFAAEQLGELGREGRERPDVLALRPVVVDATLGLFLLLPV
ncbi:MAG: hypothetical protein GY747_14110, partial [Planctomycetes bacterium]|nr:hypothetical protein [Planctomycetota bacterium]